MKTIFVLILLIVLVGGGYLGSVIVYKNIQAKRAITMGESYTKELYSEYSIVGKICQGEDTDKDNYVACDFRIKDPAGTEKTINLQCPTLWKSYTGNTCKESRLQLAN